MAVDIKISPENLLQWSHMEDWENGTSSAPTEHTLSGASATVAREGSTIKVGTYSAAVTRVGADATLYHDHPDFSDYQKRKVTFGCWVNASVASRGRIAISDGVGSTNSSYHTGTTGWEFLTVTHNVDEAATRLRVEMHVNTGNTTVYFDGGILVEGNKTYNNLTDNVDISNWAPALRYRGQQFEISRREGMKMPNNKLESRTIQLSGLATETDAATARTTMDTLMQDLNASRTKPNGDKEFKNLYLFDDRFFKVHIQSFRTNPRPILKNISFEARFIASDPFERYVQLLRKAVTIDSSPKTFTLTTNGSANTRCIITVTAGSANITALTVENFTSDQIFTYNGTITASQKLVVDTDLLTVENNGSDDVANVSNQIGIILVPGDNEFEATITGGSTDSTIKVDWYDLWY